MADTNNDTYQLSDGSFFDLPVGTDAATAAKIADQHEAQMAIDYGKQAAQQNSPVTAGSKVYSATTVYPNTYIGQGMAWLDHNAGGNWMNRNIVQPVDAAQNQLFGGTVEQPVMRAASNVAAASVDVPGSIFNTVKHYTPLGTEYDVPNLAHAIRAETGVQEMDPNAPFYQRAGEAALTTLMARGNPIQAVTGGILGTAGGDIGNYFHSEGLSYLLSMLGASGGKPAEKVIAKVTAPPLRSPSAPETWNSMMNIRPTTPGGNFRGLATPAPTGTPDYSNATPSFTSLANPSGQRIASSLSSFPWSGQPIESATETTRGFIQHARDAVAQEYAAPGGGLPIGQPVSPATIGQPLIRGAQTAYNALNTRVKSEQENIDQQMATAPRVPMSQTVQTAYDLTGNNLRGVPETAATRERVGDIVAASPGGSNYAGPEVPLPARPAVPWTNAKDFVSNLTASLAQSGRPALPPDIAAALKTVANQERENAANAWQPGLGDAFRTANENYARAQPTLQQFGKIGGTPIGNAPPAGAPPGTMQPFENVPPEHVAAQALTGNLQSPDYLSSILMHPDFPEAQRLNAVGQLVSTLGNQGDASNFRPEKFVTDWRGAGGTKNKGAQPAVEALSATSSGQPLAGTDVLNNAANIAENFSTPTSRFGLIKSLGAAATVAKLMELGGKGIEYATHFKPAQYVGVPLFARTLSAGLESDPMRRALAGQPQNWRDMANSLPALMAVSQAQDNRRRILANQANPPVAPQ
jgi:hypothetical protein